MVWAHWEALTKRELNVIVPGFHGVFDMIDRNDWVWWLDGTWDLHWRIPKRTRLFEWIDDCTQLFASLFENAPALRYDPPFYNSDSLLLWNMPLPCSFVEGRSPTFRLFFWDNATFVVCPIGHIFTRNKAPVCLYTSYSQCYLSRDNQDKANKTSSSSM